MEQKRKIKIVFNPNSDVITTGHNDKYGDYVVKYDSNDNTILRQLLKIGDDIQSKITFINDPNAPFFRERWIYNDKRNSN